MAESDWKILRQLRKAALDRFCQRMVAEVSQIPVGSNRTPASGVSRWTV